jgi:putative ABC transport system ATP-binding protein
VALGGGVADDVHARRRLMPFLEAQGLWKEFPQPGQTVAALRGVSLAVERGEFVVITGESGSGKTTLLSLLAGLDRPTRGIVRFRDAELNGAAAGRVARLRREHMGFVFQDFRLIRHLTVLDNVRLPALFGGGASLAEDALRLIDRVNMTHRLRQRPDSLSRGEMQRVALARALVNRPEVLFADEPTANLDRRNSDVIWDLLRELHDSDGLTLLVATHSHDPARGAGRVLRLDDGSLVSDATP